MSNNGPVDPYRTPGRVADLADPEPEYERCTLCDGTALVFVGYEFAWAQIDCTCHKGVTWDSYIEVERWIYRDRKVPWKSHSQK